MTAQQVEGLVVSAAVVCLGIMLLAGVEVRGMPRVFARRPRLFGGLMVAVGVGSAVSTLLGA